MTGIQKMSSKASVFAAIIFLAACQVSQAQTDSAYQWQQAEKSLTLLKEGRTIWHFGCESEKGTSQPYFCPVGPVGGPNLVWFRPDDHPWHPGLWFSWKLINGVNYWDWQQTGKMEGITEITSAEMKPASDGSAHIEMKLRYCPVGQSAVMTETRCIDVSAPDAQGGCRIDWDMTFTAGGSDLLLDRTPPANQPEGKAWGGYGGLGFRLVQDFNNVRFLDSEGGTEYGGLDAACHGHCARWLGFAGERDGRRVGFVIIDHPGNFRYPTAWWSSGGSGGYVGAAPLFHKPYVLQAGGTIRVRYRVLIHSNELDAKSIDKEWLDYINGTETAAENFRGLSEEEKAEGFELLFNGRDLSGWTGEIGGVEQHNYYVENGKIICPKDAVRLYTEKQYKNFVIRFEYKLTPGANNGLGMRAAMKSWGTEVQILDDDSPEWNQPKRTDMEPSQYNGSIYGRAAAEKGHLRPMGQWNQMQVTVTEPRCTVRLNGVQILDAAGKMKQKEAGHIVLLGHSAHVEFRNLRIKSLSE